jgi:subtilisin family serine protease
MLADPARYAGSSNARDRMSRAGKARIDSDTRPTRKELLMKSTYIILKGKGFETAAAARAPGQAPAAVSLEVGEIGKQELRSLRRDTDVIGIAPSMPMKLIEPLQGPAVGATAELVTWGVKAVKADTSPFTGEGIVVAVLDTGIDATHPAFRGVELVQRDFTGEGDGDDHGHGTHCAGTIFGRDVGTTRIGVARGVEKAVIGKVLGSNGGGSSDEIVRAMLWALDEGANVLSMSLGMDFPGYVEQLVDQGMPAKLATSRALEAYRTNVQLFDTLVAHVKARGGAGHAAIVVAAAGNESERKVNPDFEIGVSPPAVAEGVVSVAALGTADGGFAVADFSNTGALVAGPGVAILSAKAGGGLRSMSGTSMATPHVAGVAALWAEKLKKGGRLTSTELAARLIGSGVSEGLKAGFDPFDVGSGMVTAPQQ